MRTSNEKGGKKKMQSRLAVKVTTNARKKIQDFVRQQQKTETKKYDVTKKRKNDRQHKRKKLATQK